MDIVVFLLVWLTMNGSTAPLARSCNVEAAVETDRLQECRLVELVMVGNISTRTHVSTLVRYRNYGI
jgi:hypothetical protein